MYFPLIDEMTSNNDATPKSNENPLLVDDVAERSNLMDEEDNEGNVMRYDFCRDPKQKYSLGTWEVPMAKLRKTASDECPSKGNTNLNS